jgi:hypothetical protein
MSDITIDLGQDCFIPVSELKEMRRSAINAYKAERLLNYAKNGSKADYITRSAKEYFAGFHYLKLDVKKIFAAVNSAAAVSEKLLEICDYIVLNPENYDADILEKFIKKIGSDRAVLDLPALAAEEDLPVLRNAVKSGGFENFIVNNLYSLELTKGKTIVLGSKMNVLNDLILPSSCAYIASPEAETPRKNAINYIYGRFPLMTLKHCFRRNILNLDCADCGRDTRGFSLVDGTGAAFPYRRYKISRCYYEILNSLPLDNREVLSYNDCSVLIDLSNIGDADAVLHDILNNPHSNSPHTHGNYKREFV